MISGSIKKRMIKVPFIVEGTHRYPAAGTDPALADVAYLANEHLHYFHFYVSIEVFHNDRCIEFQQFRRYCEALYRGKKLIADYKSCEMLAEELIEEIASHYPGRDMIVAVYEDNINGCILSYEADKRS